MTDKFEKVKECVQKIFNLDTPKIIFIYTPPKVGSTTLVTSLRVSLGKSYNVIHIHDDIMLNVLTGITNISVNDIINYTSQIGKEVYVIDIYRTPVERKISAFFEKISNFHFNNTEENVGKYKIQKVISRFNKLFPHLETGDHYFEKYDIENPIPFDFEKKYTVQEKNNIKYIKLRLCDSDIWSGILTQIFNTPIVIINDYQTDNKLVGDLYKKFKTEYMLPDNFFDLIKNCKYINFYYSEKERNNYFDIWKNKLCDSFRPFSDEEYKFYVNLSLENQYINDIQLNHYIDNGCFCNLCNNKRREIFIRSQNGEVITEKIIHTEVINNVIERRNNKIKKFTEIINTHIIKGKSNRKFKEKQFTINIK